MDVGVLSICYILLPCSCPICMGIWTPTPLTTWDKIVAVFFLQEAIMEPLDHKNLDKDVPYFAEIVRWVMETPRGIGSRVKEQSSRLSPTSQRAALIPLRATHLWHTLVRVRCWVPCLPASPAAMQPASLGRAGRRPAGAAAVLHTQEGTTCLHLRTPLQTGTCHVSLLCGQLAETDMTC